MERLRDDPFYLADDRPATKLKVDDVDSIPVVRLDDLPPLPQSSGEIYMVLLHIFRLLTVIRTHSKLSLTELAEHATIYHTAGLRGRQSRRDARGRQICEELTDTAV